MDWDWPTIVAAYLSGIGTSHLWLMKKVNRLVSEMVGLKKDVSSNKEKIEQVETRADKECENLRTSTDQCMKMHTESMALFGKIVDQNSILIHRHFDEKN